MTKKKQQPEVDYHIPARAAKKSSAASEFEYYNYNMV